MTLELHRRKPPRPETDEADGKENRISPLVGTTTAGWRKHTPCNNSINNSNSRVVTSSGRTVTSSSSGIFTPHRNSQSLKRTPTSKLANDSFTRRSPLSPLQNVMDQMRSKVEQRLGDSRSSTPVTSQDVTSFNVTGTTHLNSTYVPDDNISPGLARLRNTPVGVFKAKQELLIRKHQSARKRADSLCVGGGVSLWPEMARMRLTCAEGAALVVLSAGLVVLTAVVFHLIHGSLQKNLMMFYHKAAGFSARFPVDVHRGQDAFNGAVLDWHAAFTNLVDSVHGTFDVTLENTTLIYKLLVILYVLGLAVLLYYLVDSIWAKSKLTPKRIRIWVCLLAVIGCWTLLGLQLLVLAQALETTLELSVHKLSETLANVVYVDLDLTTYHNVLLYWRTRMLPPTTRGTLCIMGVLPVRDVAYYLQYYSLPVITALLTPVVQLVIALKNIYWIKTHV